MARPGEIKVDDLVGVREVAELAKVTPAAVANWRIRYIDFPRPVKKLRMGPLFDRNEIEFWLITHNGLTIR